MGSWVDILARHGVLLLFAVCFVEALGLPVPAAVALVTAGALVAVDKMPLEGALLGSVVAFLAGDVLYFLLGRYTGWWLLGALCRLSTNPESCLLNSAEAFYRRGRIVLVGAKFIPGLNTMAPPLAGSMGMPVGQFLALDLAGILLYVGAYIGAGYAFRVPIVALLARMEDAGRVFESVLFIALVGYAGYRVWLAWKARIYRAVPNAEISEIDGPIFDVRSHGYYEDGAQRILGSQRLEPNRLPQTMAHLPEGEKIYLYCT